MQGVLHLSVPQAVDEGVQHWVKETVKQRQHFLLFLSLIGVWDHINHHGYAEEEPDHAEVGGAGGEGLPAAIPRLDLQDGPEDASIGHQHQAEGPD